MLFFIKKSKGAQAPPENEKRYSKTKVIEAMGRLLDWQFGKKGAALRDQYDGQLESIRKERDGRERPLS
jgi:hypothetical protein